MEIMMRNIEEAKRALTQKPVLATSVERILIFDRIKSEGRELPHPLRFSKFLSILLSEVSTPLEPYDLIAGRYVDRELNDEEEKIFQRLIRDPEYPHRTAFLSSGHCTYSWEMVAREGLVGLRERARAAKESAFTEDQKIFLGAIIEIYDAIQSYMLRYADAAEQKGMEQVAKNLRRAALEKPSSFAPTLQLLWIIAMIDCAYITRNPTLTLGRLDQILYPFYQADLQSGALTREEARALITDYYCKHNLIMGRGEHQVGDESNSTTFNRICNFDAPQYLLLAGTDEQGKLAANDLTELFAECIVPEFKNPVIVVRYVVGMEKERPTLWKILTDRALASSSLMFYNDNNILSTLHRMGIPEKDARRYSHFGCNWPSLGDKSGWMLLGPNADKFGTLASEEEKKELCIPFMRTNAAHGWAEDLMIVLRTLADRDPETVTIEDVYRLFFERMADFIDRKLSYLSHELSARKRRPSAVLTFGDCFFEESLNNAECFAAGATYHFELQSFYMFGTVVDCFLAVDQLVMREKKLTLRELLDAADADFEGYGHVLALCRNAEKYGMDTPLSNAHAERLSHTASEMVIEKSRPYLEREGLLLVPCMQSDTWHLKLGETYGATVDGRRAYTPFSQNSRPTNGVCVNGLTAMLNSMLRLPSDGLLSGALNLDVDPKQFAGEDGKQVFSALLASYFRQGGLHAQVSSTNLHDLMDAQKNPDAHRDLRVRVTGYSGVFVDICPRLQNDIIERFK